MRLLHRKIQCRRCRLPRMIIIGEQFCARCIEIRHRQERLLCTATIWHGPGHQSNTHCEQQIGGAHETFNGRLLHHAHFSGQYAEWLGPVKFTDYFDAAPDSPREQLPNRKAAPKRAKGGR